MISTSTLQGDEAAASLRHALDQVAAKVPYLRAEVGGIEYAEVGTGVDDGEAWLSCRELLNDAEWLEGVIKASGIVLGTDDSMVAASIFVQGYAYRLLAMAVSCLVVGGLVPDSDPGRVGVGISRGRPAKVAYSIPEVTVVCTADNVEEILGQSAIAESSVGLLLDTVVEGHLHPLVVAVRSRVRIGERLLWGNVAASAATAFRTMEGCLGSWVKPLGNRFFELGPSYLQGLGSFLELEEEGKPGWFWERTSCCLYDRLPGRIRCADCSLTPPGERRASYRASLIP